MVNQPIAPNFHLGGKNYHGDENKQEQTKNDPNPKSGVSIMGTIGSRVPKATKLPEVSR